MDKGEHLRDVSDVDRDKRETERKKTNEKEKYKTNRKERQRMYVDYKSKP